MTKVVSTLVASSLYGIAKHKVLHAVYRSEAKARNHNHEIYKFCLYWYWHVISSNLINWINSIPLDWRNFPMSVELRISSFPFSKCPRVRPCECGCIHEDAFFPIPAGGFNYSADGWSTC